MYFRQEVGSEKPPLKYLYVINYLKKKKKRESKILEKKINISLYV